MTTITSKIQIMLTTSPDTANIEQQAHALNLIPTTYRDKLGYLNGEGFVDGKYRLRLEELILLPDFPMIADLMLTEHYRLVDKPVHKVSILDLCKHLPLARHRKFAVDFITLNAA